MKADGDDDELMFATNWIRAFKKIHQELKWINAFGIINEIAAQKILKKFMKEFFDCNDNILDKNIHQKLRSCNFTQRDNLNILRRDFTLVVADFFTNDNIREAEQLIDQERFMIRRQDLAVIMCAAGVLISMLLFVMVTAAFVFPVVNEKHDLVELFDGIRAANPIMRLTFIVCFLLFAVGVCISVFRRYEINYLHIFELDYNFKVQQN